MLINSTHLLKLTLSISCICRVRCNVSFVYFQLVPLCFSSTRYCIFATLRSTCYRKTDIDRSGQAIDYRIGQQCLDAYSTQNTLQSKVSKEHGSIYRCCITLAGFTKKQNKTNQNKTKQTNKQTNKKKKTNIQTEFLST